MHAEILAAMAECRLSPPADGVRWAAGELVISQMSHELGQLFRNPRDEALYRELALPPTERTWHGTLFRRVPYDLRAPTIQRPVSSVWRPSDPRVLVPTAFGVGWTINLAFPLRETLVS